MKGAKRICQHRAAAVLLGLLLLAAALPLAASAQDSGEIVRVGWFESPFNQSDDLGRRSGYAYSYQQKIAAHTGWNYEYVEGSWPELLEMLSQGRIDLLSDVSYKEERAKDMLYSSLPMGAEQYCIFIAPGNQEISPENLSSVNGKRAGVNKGSIQADMFRRWMEANGIAAEVVELTGQEEENIRMLDRGEIDLYVALDIYADPKCAVPLCEVGSSDFYFAVSRNRPELLVELNSAMSRIQDENQYYNEQLYTKYMKTSGVNLFLSAEEQAYLDGHGPIRVGYQDNYLAFCARDPKTGKLTGALKDYLAYASDCMENAHLEFECIAYPTAAAALEALKKGELDCVFPANLTDYDGETQGFFMTPALMRTDMSAVVRAADQKSFLKAERVTVAVNTGNTNYDMFLLDYFPEWRSIYFKDTPECLQAIADGKADCLLISNYRFNNIAGLCQKLGLTTQSTGVEMDYCFAVDRKNMVLYSILSKITGIVPAATVNSFLSFYYTADARNSIHDLIRQNLGLLILLVIAVLLVILFLLMRGSRSEKKASDGQKLISATELDPLTGLYNRNYFAEYIVRRYRENPERRMDAIVLDIEQFHSVTAIGGREFGEQVIRTLGEELHAFLRENDGIGARPETDHFAIFCTQQSDYEVLFERLQDRLDQLHSNVVIRLRMGVMPWQEGMEPEQQMEHAYKACCMARGHFSDHLVVFDDELRRREAFRQRLSGELRGAIENRELEVYYQPKYDVSCQPPRLISAEALVKWQHPELGLLQPGEFVPLFEESGQIGDVDRFVLGEAARQTVVWRKRRGVTIPVSVNVSRADILDMGLDGYLEGLLAQYGLAPSDLKLEFAETDCSEHEYPVTEALERLRRRGFEMELDHFGCGCASLDMLSSMPLDVLKIDRSIIGNVEHNAKDAQMIRMILGIAENLGVPVVAVGVENETQLRLLKEMGCTLVQGFCFSRPLLPSEFEAVIIGKN